MNLPDYIRQVGIKEFAAQVGVSERAATAYLYGYRRPRAKAAEKIVLNSPVTWEGIYGPKAKSS